MSKYEYLNKMHRAYFACALWSSLDEQGEPLDAKHSMEEFTGELWRRSLADCRTFHNLALAFRNGNELPEPEQLGHDFWLTRNHHGAGLWDRGMGAWGDTLTRLAHCFPELDLVVGDDDQLYFQ